MGGRRITDDEVHEMWRRRRLGESVWTIGAAMGRSHQSVARMLHASAGVWRVPSSWSGRRLSLLEREEISRGLRAEESLRVIAAGLGRAPSTISREVRAGGGCERYRACAAHVGAARRNTRPKVAKLAGDTRLGAEVEAMLEDRCSPQQIARRLRRLHPDDPERWVSHETIYQSLFVQGRGALRKELAACLRSGRAQRRPQRRSSTTRGRIPDMVMISERPAEVEDRAVPGHWEGDLIIGKNNRSQIGTLVERATRYVMLMALPQDRTAETVRHKLTQTIQRLPVELRRSLTWDQGKEMAEHVTFSVATNVQVYFCDPHSPWQRGTNENTNGLLRQYFPKGTDLSGYTQDQLDAVADQLNRRPRQTLEWMTPSERLAEAVATTA